MPNYQGVWNISTQYQNASGWPVPPEFALFLGGTPLTNVVDRVEITTTGNATDFGDLLSATSNLAALSSKTRSVVGGGYTGSNTNVIQYSTFGTTGSFTDFGDLLAARDDLAGSSNSTRGLFAGGNGPSNVIQYITIASTGNATDFGDMTETRDQLGACASSTRSVMISGFDDNQSLLQDRFRNTIDYVTIASTGNATDFGDNTISVFQLTSCSNSTRGLGIGGSTYDGDVNTVSYITIASTGNAADFGDLSGTRILQGSAAGSTRALAAGGQTINKIDYFTISTTGNATDFGDLTVARYALAGCSNAHGGL